MAAVQSSSIDGRWRARLVSPRCFLPSIRRCCDPRVGRVDRRGRSTWSAPRRRSTSRSSASARLRSCERSSSATMRIDRPELRSHPVALRVAERPGRLDVEGQFRPGGRLVRVLAARPTRWREAHDQFVARDLDARSHHQPVVVHLTILAPCAVPCGDGRHQARLQHGVLVGRSARRRRSKRSSKPSGSDSTRSGRRRRTAPTRSRHSPGGERARPKLKLGTAIMQMSARTPATAAMAAITLDHLSNGRFILGLGASGPQVVEGWYGEPYPRPLARTREYVDIVRKIVARDEPVEYHGDVLRHAAPGRCRARQGPEIDRPSAAERDPDLPRRRGPEERRAGGRDLRRLAPAVLLPEGGRVLPRLSPAGFRGLR